MNSERLYAALINNAQMRGLGKGVYFEKHHILPRGMGGKDEVSNLVRLTAREHFLAHWLLFKIHKNAATSRAFKLMVQDREIKRGKDYAAAREIMASAMRGELNIAKRLDVRVKLKAKAHAPFKGLLRNDHSMLMHEKGLWLGEKNPGFGRSEEQRGAKNHYAVAIRGVHPIHGERVFSTLTEAGNVLGVSYQAIYQADKKKQKTKGWTMERIV
jgi:hypothetical protein